MINFVYPEELYLFVESVGCFQVKDVGSTKWLEVHEMVIKLSQQAALEASEHREECVKEFLISRDKLSVLIHEAYCVNLWKGNVLPHLLEIDPNPQATFLIYTVLYHEAAAISLLDLCLYHPTGCESLQDSVLDLIDYCAQTVAQVIGLVNTGYLEEQDAKRDVNEAVLTELERQKRDFIFKIGLCCISILSYVADNLNLFHLGAARRMFITHDIPWLMTDVLNTRPWQRKTSTGIEKYIDGKWTAVEDMVKVVKPEAQAWFCVRQLLTNPQAVETYALNEPRCKQLSNLMGMMHETLLDQLPVLIELKQYISRMTLSGSTGNKNQNLLLEDVPEVRDLLMNEVEEAGGFYKIAQSQDGIFLNKNKEEISAMATKLSSAYGTDILCQLEQHLADLEIQKPEPRKVEEVHKCGKCNEPAKKKCANCKLVHYCSRECQLEDWAEHKESCKAV